MRETPVISLKPKKEESVLRFHPWIFSGAIRSMEDGIKEGDLVSLRDSGGNFLAWGHYQVGSIAVRILSFKEEECIDRAFWQQKIQTAYRLREALGLIRPGANNCYRLIHGEGDGLPGMVVDVYDKTAVMQAHSVGMHQVRQLLAEVLADSLPGLKNIYYKSETTLPYYAPVEAEDGYLIGGNTDSEALENGLRFRVDWLHGQKTGFFIDQRENRSLLEHYAGGRVVLNMFCYTGGFSVYALRGGARLVHSVDSSAKAVELTKQNVAANFPADDLRHAAFAEDAFRYFKDNGQAYDLIVLDPPAFAKHRSALHNALKGYQRLNARAFEQILPGGLLFTFSCSQAVSKEQFRLAVFSAAAESGRKIRILHQLTQGPDHPINIYHPEGEYLKGLVLAVE